MTLAENIRKCILQSIDDVIKHHELLELAYLSSANKKFRETLRISLGHVRDASWDFAASIMMYPSLIPESDLQDARLDLAHAAKQHASCAYEEKYFREKKSGSISDEIKTSFAEEMCCAVARIVEDLKNKARVDRAPNSQWRDRVENSLKTHQIDVHANRKF